MILNIKPPLYSYSTLDLQGKMIKKSQSLDSDWWSLVHSALSLVLDDDLVFGLKDDLGKCSLITV